MAQGLEDGTNTPTTSQLLKDVGAFRGSYILFGRGIGLVVKMSQLFLRLRRDELSVEWPGQTIGFEGSAKPNRGQLWISSDQPAAIGHHPLPENG
jgi:hypothetical protein